MNNINPIDQTSKLGRLSDRYQVINTRQILDAFQSKGWEISKESVSRSSVEPGYQKHMIRLVHQEFQEIQGLTENNRTRLELVVLNSHNGTSALRIFFGALRFACMNGIIAGTALHNYRVTHTKHATKKLDEAIDYMRDGLPQLIETIIKMQGYTPSEEERRDLVKVCYEERLRKTSGVTGIALHAPAIRYQDRAEDLYTLYNKVQERLIRGGIPYTKLVNVKDNEGKVIDQVERRASTRQVYSLPKTLELNQFALSEAMKLVA